MTLLLPTQKLLSTQRLLPTSTAGSLPKPSWLAEPEKIWSPWALEGEQLLEFGERKVRRADTDGGQPVAGSGPAQGGACALQLRTRDRHRL